MKSLYSKWDYLLILIVVALLVFYLSSCMTNKITNAQPAILVNSERVKHSTNYLICIQAKDGTRYSGYYNVHCYDCDANIPANWNVVLLKNGKVYFEPIQ